jgi:hypothetical protein
LKLESFKGTINALAAPTGKDADGNAAGNDGMSLFDVEYLIIVSSPFHWFEADDVIVEDR